MKRKLFIILPVVLTVSTAVGAIFPQAAFADAAKVYNPEDVIKITKDNDLQKKINDFETNIKSTRAAYSGNGVGFTLWSSLYGMSIAPLFNDVSNKQTDYSNLESNLTTELSCYKLIYKYWLAKENVKVNETNKELAQKEYDIAKDKNSNGRMSDSDLLQAQVGLNDAVKQYDDAETQLQQMVYSVNNTMNIDIASMSDINTPDFAFIDDSKLDTNVVVPSILITHPALVPYNKSLAAYNKAIGIVSQEDPNNLTQRDSIIQYYNQEIYGVNLRLQQKKEIIEYACYNYVAELKSLENDININQDNLKLSQDVYDKSLSLYDVGRMTSTDLEKVRLNILNANLSLINSEESYMATAKEYELFGQGYLPMSGASGN